MVEISVNRECRTVDTRLGRTHGKILRVPDGGAVENLRFAWQRREFTLY